MLTKTLLLTLTLTLTTTNLAAQHPSSTWNPNLPGNKYRNPIIDADYSDPDVCRVGDDYYMTSSSFACFPGLQILHSRDLVNWQLIGAALTDGYPVLPEYQGTDLDWHKRIQHGNYVWAPSIRYHDGWFYIYCGDPDQGLFMTRTQNPAGPWEPITWVMKGKGFIDCCPLWDDDGNAYLSHGCAGSRAGVKSVLFVAPMSPDGTKVIGPSRIVYDGHENQPTIEGTKFYKRNGYYYIMSPAGGVKYGWQVELRSRSPYGPYDEYVGLAQGKSKVNGPHQGAWIDTPYGEDWFIHFQDKHAYGRVVHLQPAHWHNDWLVIGNDKDGDGCGDPVMTWQKPKSTSTSDCQPAEDDDFSTLPSAQSLTLGPQWQFEGPYSPYWYFLDAANSRLRLYGVSPSLEGMVGEGSAFRNLSDLQNVLLQKFPTENFTATAKVRFIPNPDFKPRAEEGGFIVKGQDYAAIKFVTIPGADNDHYECVMRYVVCKNAFGGKPEEVITEIPVALTPLPAPYTQKYAVDDIPQPRLATPDVYVRVKVHSTDWGNNIKCHAQFSYSLDGKSFTKLGNEFEVKEGRWIGAKLGFYCMKPAPKNDSPFFDIDWIKFSK